jgi:hypothetical protein
MLRTDLCMLNSNQKHDCCSAAPTSSDGEQSSLRKAFTAPSTPLGNELIFQTEQGTSNHLLPENVSADLLTVVLGKLVFESIAPVRPRWHPRSAYGFGPT